MKVLPFPSTHQFTLPVHIHNTHTHSDHFERQQSSICSNVCLVDCFGRALDKREYLMIIFFLFLIETIGCDPSSEPSHRDGSDEGSQHMVLCRINKIYP